MSTENPQVGISKKTMEELIGDKAKLTDFTTAALIHAVSMGLRRIKDIETAPNHVNQFIETLRKVRADLTGDDHEKGDVPQMMVNIQFNNAQNEVRSIDVAPAKKKPLTPQEQQLMETTSEALDTEASQAADLFSGE